MLLGFSLGRFPKLQILYLKKALAQYVPHSFFYALKFFYSKGTIFEQVGIVRTIASSALLEIFIEMFIFKNMTLHNNLLHI